MSYSQVGSRTVKNILNHLLIVNSIIHEAIKKKISIDLEVLDVQKCFDSLDLIECCNNLFEYGIKDDRLALLYEGMRENDVAVSSPLGMSERMAMPDIVGQGGALGPVCCSVTIDDIGKDRLSES